MATCKAYLSDKRIEEEWHVRVDDLLRFCKIPVRDLESIRFEKDYDMNRDECDRQDEVLVIKLTRDNVNDRAKRAKQ